MLEEYHNSSKIRRAADKSLARPGKEQATAPKLGIYSTYFPRSSINLLATQKRIQKVACPTKSRRQEWPPLRTKNGQISIVFSVQRTDGSPTGPDPVNRVGDQDIRNPGRPVFLWVASARCAGALSCKNKTTLVNFPRRFYFKMSFNSTSRDD